MKCKKPLVIIKNPRGPKYSTKSFSVKLKKILTKISLLPLNSQLKFIKKSLYTLRYTHVNKKVLKKNTLLLKNSFAIPTNNTVNSNGKRNSSRSQKRRQR